MIPKKMNMVVAEQSTVALFYLPFVRASFDLFLRYREVFGKERSTTSSGGRGRYRRDSSTHLLNDRASTRYQGM